MLILNANKLAQTLLFQKADAKELKKKVQNENVSIYLLQKDISAICMSIVQQKNVFLTSLLAFKLKHSNKCQFKSLNLSVKHTSWPHIRVWDSSQVTTCNASVQNICKKSGCSHVAAQLAPELDLHVEAESLLSVCSVRLTLLSRVAISCWLAVESRKLLICPFRGSSTSTSMS